MKRQKIGKKPLQPFVTLDEAMAFEAENQATWTRSPFVNAVLEAMTVVRPTTARRVALYLDMEERDLLSGMRIATGYTYLQFRYHLILRRLEVLRKEHKHVITDAIALQLGFASRAALSTFLNNKKTQDALKNNGPSHYATPCPGRRKFAETQVHDWILKL